MAIQIPSFIQNAPAGSNPNAPSSLGSGSHPKTSFLRIILFIFSLVAIGGIVGYYVYTNMNKTDENVNLVVNQDNANKNNNQNINTKTNSNANSSQPVPVNAEPILPTVNSVTNQVVNNANVNSNSNLNTNITPNLNLQDGLNINIKVFQFDNDTDKDGLFDIIEGWYGTSSSTIDTDSDGYTDFQEIDSCYDPLGNGRMNNNNFYTLCTNYLANLSATGLYDISSTNAQIICSDWGAQADSIIESNINGNDISSFVFDQQICQKTNSFVNNGDICADLELMTISICDNSGLQILTLLLEE